METCVGGSRPTAESRGGACRSELIIDDDPISYPAVTQPDLMLAMTQLACDKYHCDLAPGGLLLIDSLLVKDPPAGNIKVIALPLTALAREKTGKEITANVAALGAIAVLNRNVGLEAVRRAIVDRLPAPLLAINQLAFQAGVDAARGLA